MKLIKIYGLAFGSAIFSVIITSLIQLIIQPIAVSIDSSEGLWALFALLGMSAILLGPLIGIGIPIVLIRKKYGKDIGNRVLIRALLFLFILVILLIKLVAL